MAQVRSSAPRMVFAADVHLEPSRPDRAERFLAWIESLDPKSDELWLLGDLFDLWVAPRQATLPFYRPLIDRLAARVRDGLVVRFVHGNRDFLLGSRFERKTGIHVHEDPMVAEHCGKRLLLTH